MEKELPKRQHCSLCGHAHPMTHYLSIVKPSRTFYGRVCAECRGNIPHDDSPPNKKSKTSLFGFDKLSRLFQQEDSDEGGSGGFALDDRSSVNVLVLGLHSQARDAFYKKANELETKKETELNAYHHKLAHEKLKKKLGNDAEVPKNPAAVEEHLKTTADHNKQPTSTPGTEEPTSLSKSDGETPSHSESAPGLIQRILSPLLSTRTLLSINNTTPPNNTDKKSPSSRYSYFQQSQKNNTAPTAKQQAESSYQILQTQQQHTTQIERQNVTSYMNINLMNNLRTDGLTKTLLMIPHHGLHRSWQKAAKGAPLTSLQFSQAFSEARRDQAEDKLEELEHLIAWARLTKPK